MKKIFVIIILFLSNISHSQNSKFSSEINYINPFDHNFLADNYKGIIDLGIKYRFINLKRLNIGFSMNIGMLRTENGYLNATRNYDITVYQLQPKLVTEFNFRKFHPFFAVGYTSMIFRSNDSNDEITTYYTNHKDAFSINNTQSGLDLNIGLKYSVYKTIFIQIQYDYIMLNTERPIQYSTYNTNVNIFKIGTGLDF